MPQALQRIISMILKTAQVDSNACCSLQKKLPPSSSTMGKLLRPAMPHLPFLAILQPVGESRVHC